MIGRGMRAKVNGPVASREFPLTDEHVVLRRASSREPANQKLRQKAGRRVVGMLKLESRHVETNIANRVVVSAFRRQ